MKSFKTIGLLLSATALIVACGDDETTTTATATTTATSSTATGTGGAGGEAATTTTATGAGGAGGGMMQSACEAYCDTITANCTGNNAQYSDKAHCVASCAAFPKGTAADTTGNTVGCRAYHAGAAKMDPAVHCSHAGPGGDGACGTNCEGFCAIALKACSAKYADKAACETECKAFKDTVDYNATVTTGDSLACRLYHLTVASVDPTVHCDHITATSPVCTNP
ncbi:MAG: hypothetical protein FJ096_11860 [Deltaproteobacteria bacterium]|nr:hypothetical protein [Deltaproteobacteria bacterium]